MRLLFFLSFFFPPSHYSIAVYETILPSPPPPPSPPHHHLSLIPSKQILFADFTCVCPFSGHPDFIAFIKQSNVIIFPQLWFGWFFSRAVMDNNVCGGEREKKSPRRVSNLLNKGYTVRWNSQKCCICVFLSQTSFFPLLLVCRSDTLRQLVNVSQGSFFHQSVFSFLLYAGLSDSDWCWYPPSPSPLLLC